MFTLLYKTSVIRDSTWQNRHDIELNNVSTCFDAPVKGFAPGRGYLPITPLLYIWEITKNVN